MKTEQKNRALHGLDAPKPAAAAFASKKAVLAATLRLGASAKVQRIALLAAQLEVVPDLLLPSLQPS